MLNALLLFTAALVAGAVLSLVAVVLVIGPATFAASLSPLRLPSWRHQAARPTPLPAPVPLPTYNGRHRSPVLIGA